MNNNLTHHKQCDAYYEALKNKDYISAYWLHLPPTPKAQWLIEAERRLEMLKYNHESELERIRNMSPELLKIELKFKK